MPADSMFVAHWVELKTPIEQVISRPGRKALCASCGEEIMNAREVRRDGRVLCLACAGQAYYRQPDAAPLVFRFALEAESLAR